MRGLRHLGYGAFELCGSGHCDTLPAALLSPGAVTLMAAVNPNGFPITAWFEWGATTNYGNTTTITNLGSSTNWVVIGF